jgi:diguanylate cyclase (GGDEF)-like protein/PAS domain S-box-containing protein
MARVLKYSTAEHPWRIVLLAGALCLLAGLAAMSTTTVAVVAAAVLVTRLLGIAAERRMRAAYRKRNHRLKVALNNMSQGLCMFDAASRLVVCNRRYVEMYGLPAEAVKPGGTLRDLLQHRIAGGSFAADPDHYIDELMRSMEQGRVVSKVVERGDGRVVEVVNSPMPGGGWVATHEDITERRRAEKALEETRQFVDMVIESVPAAIIVKDARDLRYMLINKTGEEYYGIAREQVVGKTAHDIFPQPTAELITAHDRELVATCRPFFREEHAIETPGRGVMTVTSTRRPVLGDDGRARYLLSIVQDVSERKRAEARIAHMAQHDALTDLPNRVAFNERFAQTLAAAAKGNLSFAVMSIDLDRLKEINDVFGHAAGDALLRAAARRLSTAGGESFLARLGGDEFALLVTAGEQPASAALLADRIVAAGADEFDIEGRRLRIGISVGVAVHPDDGVDAAALLGNAEAALHRAKAGGGGAYRFFEADMDQRLRERRALVHDLRSAVDRGEIAMHYQPLARIGGEITAFEALVRWQHPVRGMIPPIAFIPAAEESGLILELGEWILRDVCREAASWPRPLHVAVNLSPVQFRHGDLPGLIHSVLLDTGLAPNRLELEITEGVLIDDLPRALSILRRLKLLGVRIAMDDFGTGYSSLSNLQAFPFDKIKIDRSFISNLEGNPQSATIVRAVIALGRGLAMPVVAEGVETKEQLEFLGREACGEVQGYLIGKPLPIDAYAEAVGRRTAKRLSA